MHGAFDAVVLKLCRIELFKKQTIFRYFFKVLKFSRIFLSDCLHKKKNLKKNYQFLSS